MAPTTHPNPHKWKFWKKSKFVWKFWKFWKFWIFFPENSKFSKFLDNNVDKRNFEENLKTINKQIKQIENLVNEFSDFARMPKPIFKKSDLIKIIKENITLMSQLDASVKIDFKYKTDINWY